MAPKAVGKRPSTDETMKHEAASIDADDVRIEAIDWRWRLQSQFARCSRNGHKLPHNCHSASTAAQYTSSSNQ